MKMNRIRPKKSLGQHFLHDPRVIADIVASISVSPETKVIEIGPGTGTLTSRLVKRFPRLSAVEIDSRAVDLLRETHPDLEVIHADILKLSWDDLFTDEESVYIVGNLPYFITSQILFAILEHRRRVGGATLMMQEEVARRIVAPPANKEYGILSVQTQLMGTPEILFEVSSRAFYPPPNVTSAVLQLRFDKPGLTCSDEGLKKVVRTAFQQRRKKLSNSLKRLAPLPEDPLFDYDKRAEHWPPEMYEKLTARLEQDGTLV